MVLPAILISSDIISLLTHNSTKGVVHSIFENACNIKVDGRLITIINFNLANYPSAIKLGAENKYNLKDLGFKIGMKASLNRESISFEGIPVIVDLKKAEIWDASPVKIKSSVSEEVIKNNLEKIREVTLIHGNLDGLASILDRENANNLVEFVAPFIEELALGLKWQNHNYIKELAEKIIGFGPGLTPAADDFLLGMMASIYYIGSLYDDSFDKVKPLIHSMISDISGRTTLVSEVMLKNGANGLFHEPLRELMLALLRGEEVENKCISLLEMGGTSGSDCVAGIVYGGLLMIDMRGQRRYKNVSKVFSKEKHLL